MKAAVDTPETGSMFARVIWMRLKLSLGLYPLDVDTGRRIDHSENRATPDGHSILPQRRKFSNFTFALDQRAPRDNASYDGCNPLRVTDELLLPLEAPPLRRS